jgi:hypothetical protein
MSGTDIRKLCIPPYATPTFSAFSFIGPKDIEVGTALSGVKNFVWATTNSFNIQVNSIAIRDVTLNTLLATGLPNTGSTSTNIGVIATNAPMTHSWRAEAVDTQTIPFNSANFTVTASYKEFFGPTTFPSANSADVRALINSRFTAAGNSFSMSTGTVDLIFEICMPATMSLVSVFDATAGFFITGSFTLTTFNVNDAAANPVPYKIYRLTNAIPYAVSHTFNIVTT